MMNFVREPINLRDYRHLTSIVVVAFIFVSVVVTVSGGLKL